MFVQLSLKLLLVITSCSLIFGCGNQSQKYDPVFIANEADAGNLKPMQEVSAACKKEVAEAVVQKIACAALNEAVRLRKKIDPWKK